MRIKYYNNFLKTNESIKNYIDHNDISIIESIIDEISDYGISFEFKKYEKDYNIDIPTECFTNSDFLSVGIEVNKDKLKALIEVLTQLENYINSIGLRFQYKFNLMGTFPNRTQLYKTSINDIKYLDKKIIDSKSIEFQIITSDSRNESYDFNKLTDDELDKVVEEIVENLNRFKSKLMELIKYNLRTNKLEFEEGFENINVKDELDLLKEEFGEDIIRELNVEALLRKIFQIIVLKKRTARKTIRIEIDNYINTLEKRIRKQKEVFGDDDHFDEYDKEYSLLTRKKYEKEKYNLQVELLKLQEWVVKNNKKVAIVFEGRDAAGKGSTIKRFVEYLNPKHFRVVVMGIPTEEEKNNWFQRYEKELPKEGEIVFFDRSWYNRAVVEPAMGYCTEEQYKDFMNKVVPWEQNLIRNGTILIKFWFSITKEKQLQRFNIRQESPLKYWKFSPNDAKVIDKFEMIGDFKNEMFQKTSSRMTPWVIVNSNDKKIGRLNAIRYVLDKVDYEGKDESQTNWYPEVINVLV
jgi:polyphosphate kinase 2